ncbi:hypothetical protein IW140_002400 [Coemansia sp. RSA 1813]|nr:hypothetical protein EV178_000899 [Coemansia sp. RSA 1646]KAJ1773004.1 hypothetical protein LPJ74_000955 [Coemansia sp. RSA 1843]KAJ2092220.1 hypothetical protein IW138_001287 [Coemansia sp. RSA 986]KAJ2211338.1 hypothetical protein EV179_005566 [Coemansia sp. RSA 487]KAJ2570307.1 hypothetical protein IW140_002400 [Coemansia sp. RSA 1813]
MSNNSNNKQANAKTNASNGESKGDDTLSLFTNLGADGLDTETMDLFGSFTNDAGANNGMDGLGDLGGFGNNVFGQFSANDLSGFGVDLNSFDLGNGAGDGAGMDLSSIQLMNLDDTSLTVGSSDDHGTSQPASSTDDAAQMMARLLGPGPQVPAAPSAQPSTMTTSATLNTSAASITGTSGVNASLEFVDANNKSDGMNTSIMQSIQPTAGGTSMSGLASQGPQQPPASVRSRKSSAGSRKQKSRSSSQSSDDMGDIPLAHLTLMQYGQPAAAGGGPAQTTSAAAFNAMPVQGMGISGQLPIASPLPSQPALGQQTMAAIGAASLGMSMPSNIGIQGGISSAVLGAPGAAELFGSAAQDRVNIDPLTRGLQQQQSQIPMSQMHQQAVFQQLGQLGDLQSQMHIPGTIGAPSMTSAQAALAGPSFGASGATNTPAPENEARGVESTVHLTNQTSSDKPDNPRLKLELSRPATNTDETPLDQLEEIEDQLCGLLDTASKVARIMTGPSGGEQLGFGMDVGNTKIKSMVKEFMQSVVQIQAALQFQHRRLVEKGIPIQTSVGIQSDVAGFERDLVSWSDAARLLSSALGSAIDFSS